jgi:hypothetical protein
MLKREKYFEYDCLCGVPKPRPKLQGTSGLKPLVAPFKGLAGIAPKVPPEPKVAILNQKWPLLILNQKSDLSEIRLTFVFLLLGHNY